MLLFLVSSDKKAYLWLKKMAGNLFYCPFWGRLVFYPHLCYLPNPTTKVVIIFTSPNFFEKILTESLWTAL